MFKVEIKTFQWRHWHLSGVFFVNSSIKEKFVLKVSWYWVMCSNSLHFPYYNITTIIDTWSLPRQNKYSNTRGLHLTFCIYSFIQKKFCMKTSLTNSLFHDLWWHRGFMKGIKEVESGNREEVNRWGFLFKNVNVWVRK